MKYVLDSSVAFKWVVQELHSEEAQRLRVELCAGNHELKSPDVFAAELGHALTRAERQGRVPVGEAALLWADVLSTPPQFLPSIALMPRAIELSSQLRIGIYDCLYVALAEHDGIELITADEKLVQKLQPLFPFVISISTLP